MKIELFDYRQTKRFPTIMFSKWICSNLSPTTLVL
jgi:hypothetical protein